MTSALHIKTTNRAADADNLFTSVPSEARTKSSRAAVVQRPATVLVDALLLCETDSIVARLPIRREVISMTKLQFQLRGQEINRIEAVSDVVFGFALTLLVVSLE